MRIATFIALGLPFVLSACALTPRQQCEAPYWSDLRVVREDLRATESVLRKGYRLEPTQSEFGLHYCVFEPFDTLRLCRADDGLPMFDKKPISRVAETAKRDALLSERTRLEAALAQCAAQYPE